MRDTECVALLDGVNEALRCGCLLWADAKRREDERDLRKLRADIDASVEKTGLDLFVFRDSGFSARYPGE